jgi:NAD(P)H-hydrate epimerase
MYKGKKAQVSLSISHNKTVATAMVCGDDIEIEIPFKDEMQKLIPMRKTDAHKGDFGRVLVIAGSLGMVGAGVLSAYGALRTGCGLVTLATPTSILQTAAGFYPEIMTKGLAERDGHISVEAIPEIISLAKISDAVVFGPGVGRDEEIFVILQELLREYCGTLIIDADGLFAIARNVDILKDATCRVIITPHEGEMSRLCGIDTLKIRESRTEIAQKFADTYGACTVLKGSGTVVCKKGEGIYINPTGNPGMATAGSGDVLSGVIASLAAQGMSDFCSAKLGVYIHGLAGDFAEAKKGSHGLIASDIAENIPKAILKIKG